MEDENKENNNIRYDAFISYRHSEIDTAAAQDIQKRLEKYRIPKSIRKKTGKNRIERVFRDKVELPTTSNLNDDIGDALKNSEYLIVICSPRLKESSWCMKEIETFLHFHDRYHILTVLAEGDPYEVIPDILLHEDMIEPDGRITSKPIEPLSCDYRLKKSKRIREEFPRLAAMLIGCSYNDLIQRQKQYRQRRLMTAVAAAFVIIAVFLIYAIRSNITINENYNRSLINQSLYLTEVSQSLLEKGDREAAIKTALAALPGEDNERPFVSEPIYALNSALYTYRYASQNTFYAVKNVESKSTPSDKIVFNDSTESYAMIDSGGYGYVTDQEADKITFEDLPSGINEFDTAGFRDVYAYKDGFIFFDENAFYFIKSTGETVYYQEYEEYQDYNYYAYSLNGDTAVVVSPSETMVFNAEDGSLKYKKEITDQYMFPGICFSPSGDRFAVYSTGELLNCGCLYICDISTGDIKMIYDHVDISDACFSDDDTLAYIESPVTNSYSYFNSAEYYKSVIKCLDLNSEKILWEAEEGSLHTENEKNELSLYTWNDSGNTSFLITSGNEMIIFDPEDGTSQFCMYYESQIISTEEWTNGTVIVILNNGNVYQQYTDEDELLFYRGGINADITGAADDGKENIIMGCFDDRRYVILSLVSDDSVTALDDELKIGENGAGGDSRQEADIPNYIYATYDTGSGDYNGLRVWNGDTLEVVFDYVGDNMNCYSNKVSAEYKNGELYLILTEYCLDDENGCYYHIFKVASGEEITRKGGVACEKIADCIWIQDLDLICACCNFTDLIFYDYEGNIVHEEKVEGDDSYCTINDVTGIEGGRYLCLEGCEGEEKEIMVFDTVNNKWVIFDEYGSIIPVGDYGKFAAAKDHAELLAYTVDYRLLIFDLENGTIKTEIPFSGMHTSAFDWFDDDSKLILEGDDNYIKLWDIGKNELILQEAERTEATSIDGSASSGFFTVSTASYSVDNYIYQVDEDGSFHKYAAFSSGILNPFNQKIVIRSSDGKLAVSHIYSLEELREKAKAVIGDAKLTEEEKTKYFIN